MQEKLEKDIDHLLQLASLGSKYQRVLCMGLKYGGSFHAVVACFNDPNFLFNSACSLQCTMDNRSRYLLSVLVQCLLEFLQKEELIYLS